MSTNKRKPPAGPPGLEVIRLWPDGAPSTLADVGREVDYDGPAGLAEGTTMLRNVSQPTLTVFTPPEGRANGVGVIVVPGGGWRILAWEHEGLDVAAWLSALGYTAFLLKYRVGGTPDDPAAFNAIVAAMNAQLAAFIPAARAPRAMSDLISDDKYLAARDAAAEDGRRAIELIRGRSADWGLRALGMIGFSAGAFLTVDVAVDPRAAPLDFAGAIYGGETRGMPVPENAPALFTCIAQDDRLLLRVVEGLYAEWSQADRPVELHIFGRGTHGFGMVPQGAPSDRWTQMFTDWMRDQGWG